MRQVSSLSLHPKHAKRLDALIGAVHQATGKRISASVAIQLALLGCPLEKGKLRELFTENQVLDRRRRTPLKAKRARPTQPE